MHFVSPVCISDYCIENNVNIQLKPLYVVCDDDR